MGVFGWFGKRKAAEEKPEADFAEKNLKWNKMWALWAEGKAASPYAELMTYDGEVNNGGHYQYFSNVENTGDLQKEMAALAQILSPKLSDNLQQAYRAYLVLEKGAEDPQARETMEYCDAAFSFYEKEILLSLEDYAATLKL